MPVHAPQPAAAAGELSTTAPGSRASMVRNGSQPLALSQRRRLSSIYQLEFCMQSKLGTRCRLICVLPCCAPTRAAGGKDFKFLGAPGAPGADLE